MSMDDKQEDEDSEELVGRAVKKFFPGHGYFAGRVISYDKARKYFRVKYADGDREELELHELKVILVSDRGSAPTKRPKGRPRKLPLPSDLKVSTPTCPLKDPETDCGILIQADEEATDQDVKRQREEDNENDVNGQIEQVDEVRRPRGRPRKKPRREEESREEHKVPRPSTQRRKASLVEREHPLRRAPSRQHGIRQPDWTSINQRSEDEEEGRKVNNVIESDLNIPSLPPASLNFDLPPESVHHLFSAYMFLRSFSWVIFLSPFSLQEFIRCLTMRDANPLVDQIHLSLLLLLRQHICNLANEGLESATACVRCRDWKLLDVVTWPSYMVAYLLHEGYRREGKQKLLDIGILKNEYYQLDLPSKIGMLSFLCDRVLDTDEVRSELAKRTNADNDVDMTEMKTPAAKVKNESRTRSARKSSPKLESDTSDLVDPPTSDWNSDDCVLCGMDGNLICCDGCPAAYHSRCVGVSRNNLPEGDWYCPECMLQKSTKDGTRFRKVLRGFESLGVDTYGRRYIAACEHLFISESSRLNAAYMCYGPSDIAYAVELLDTTGAVPTVLREKIMRLWKLSDDLGLTTEDLATPAPDTSSCLKSATEGEQAGTTDSKSTYADQKQGDSSLLRKDGSGKLTGIPDNAFDACTYVNYYTSGGSATQAAAKLTERSAGKHVEGKTVQRAQIHEQIKAFSQAPVQFYWPSFRKKFMEAPKDRCGWCFACKNLSRKKGCLLNTATGRISAGAAIVSGGLRPTRKGVNHLPSLAAYVLYMEERLNGLLVGPWENADQRKRWRKSLENADHLRQVKSAVLEFGSSLRPLALSRNWSAFAEDSPKLVPSSAASSLIYLSSVRKGGGRRRKMLQESEPIKIFIGGGAWGIQWWKGGKLPRRFLDYETLSSAALRRAARQGGRKKIHGLLYNDNFEVPRRTVKCAWQARVEYSFSVSELAIQVRSLDALIRWADLSVPDEVKSYIKDFLIHEKASEGDVVKYLVSSSKPEDELKELLKPDVADSPSKFVKTLVGEEPQHTNRVWLPETHLPLCLVRDFEEKCRSHMKSGKSSSRKTLQPKATKADKFQALLSKLCTREAKNKELKCEHCDLNLATRDSVCCEECQGDFHKHCMVSGDKSAERLCRSCFIVRQSSKRSRRLSSKVLGAQEPPSQVFDLDPTNLFQVREVKPLYVYTRRRNLKPFPALAPCNVSGVRVVRKKRSKRHSNNGVRWKIQSEMTYKPDKVLYPGQSQGPRCAICLQSYDPKLFYVGCEHCQEWYHGRAMGISERNIARVAAFKCHRCRKKGSPQCPYNYTTTINNNNNNNNNNMSGKIQTPSRTAPTNVGLSGA